ncbi:MAG: hypothetical protein ACRERX_11890, partial [Pseudomonas sp.]
SDHAQILSCLTDDVEWEMPGAFHLVGKDAFDNEIENDAFVGSPTITITGWSKRTMSSSQRGRFEPRKRRAVFSAQYSATFLP